jgi:hypothetical protein
MPEDGMWVDTDGMRVYAPALEETAVRMERIADIFRSLEDSGPAAFGNDATGRSIWQQLRGPIGDIAEGLKGGSQVLTSTADGIATMSSGFHATEDDAIANANSINPGNTGSSGGGNPHR